MAVGEEGKRLHRHVAQAAHQAVVAVAVAASTSLLLLVVAVVPSHHLQPLDWHTARKRSTCWLVVRPVD